MFLVFFQSWPNSNIISSWNNFLNKVLELSTFQVIYSTNLFKIYKFWRKKLVNGIVYVAFYFISFSYCNICRTIGTFLTLHKGWILDEFIFMRTNILFSGECPTMEDQCTLLWGHNAIPSPQECFNTYNVKGNQQGNCGQNKFKYSRNEEAETEYRKCSLR